MGASAGGLEACRKLVDALPANSGMAFILVQHLDPSHESMMVDLLAGHTMMPVRQAVDGMLLERNHLYVIPPGTYLSVAGGALRLTTPQARHGARLPFDFLLRALAEEYAARAIGVILSGTGADGTLGLKAVKEKGGLVIAQDPDEAAFDGMPRSAIMTGAVDLVLPVAKIPEALAAYQRRMALAPPGDTLPPRDGGPAWLTETIDLLRARTAHDFRLYKPGTLQRRIERRMAMAGVAASDAARYLDTLRSDAAELNRLATDLLINVTSFFRDPKVFDLLAAKIIPDLVKDRGPDQPLRVWIAGCSTGEETYSLAMLFHEAIAATGRNVKLQVFASDIDPDAVAGAREGLYPDSIAADVSAARLARFFSKEEHGYRISPELRALVVFTVQDVLADPPFSRLDLVSCRNLLISLRPEAQAKVVSLFHFALREGGVLLLGSSETVAAAGFEVISKSGRMYRHIGRSRPGDIGFLIGAGDNIRVPTRPGPGESVSRQDVFAELCRRAVIETYAPAAVLINREHECLHSLGPTERYLRVVTGRPSHDLLAMVDQGVRGKLRSAIRRAGEAGARVVVPGGRTNHGGQSGAFSIAVQPVPGGAEQLLLVCFVDAPKPAGKRDRPGDAGETSRVAELERELEAVKTELQGAIRDLELSSEDQKAINEEALSVNEEYQSANEELLTSKEELQSLNEELTALNSQLQETLERQRTTSNDLQNVLYSTNVATLFLDTDLNIRFFTPATRSLFSVIPGDIGRPLADLTSLAADDSLLTEARTVLRTLEPIDREIETRAGAWFIRRILPYRAQDGGIEGVVLTFADITERKRVADALGAAKREAELANVAKSRFLAAASHDLRQPLQTLALLQGLLAMTVEGERGQKLVDRLGETLAAMSGMLNTLLDINQIEAGQVQAQIVRFPINTLLDRVRDEFGDLARAQGLALQVVPCGLAVETDPRLLDQMIRNLLTNALKYTRKGKVLLGCRRRGDKLGIEVWDTGVGIPETEFEAIFEEYHQLGNAARERSLGLGLGLAIVQRLGNLLGHPVAVRSQLGKGSVFAFEVKRAPETAAADEGPLFGRDAPAPRDVRRAGAILVVEDDPELRELLELLLKEEGYRPTMAPDGEAALDLVMRRVVRPDLILADYNLPGALNGVELGAKLREKLRRQVPVIILTGDISAETLRNVALHHFEQLNKPVRLQELTGAILRLLPQSPSATPAPRAPGGSGPAVVFVVDDDSAVRAAIRDVLEADGRTVEEYATGEAFLQAWRPGGEACLLIDAYLPGMSGLELLRRLGEAGHRLPAIMITGASDVTMAVDAMKAGACDFIEKPIGRDELIAGVQHALALSLDATKLFAWREAASSHIASLTPRQRQVMTMVLAGHASKTIAGDLGISQRTVENHRAAIMKKTGSRSLPALARLALAADGEGG